MSRQHPSLETLLDLTLGDLSEEQAYEVREHLIACPRCRREVRDLMELPGEPPAGHARVSTDEHAQARQKLSEALVAEGLGDPFDSPVHVVESAVPEAEKLQDLVPISATTDRSYRGASLGTRHWMALAAAVILAFGLGWLRLGQPSDLNRPAISVFAEGSGSVTRGPDDPTLVECPPDDHAVILSLSLHDAVDAALQVEIEYPDGRKERLARDFFANAFGQLLLVRSPGTTTAGLYVVAVFVGGAPEPLETFHFSVQCDD